jgi:hypothetical protein
VATGDLRVALGEAVVQHVRVRVMPHGGERALDQHPGAVADHPAHGGQGRTNQPRLGQHLRQHSVNVGRGFDQGTIEVEDDSAGTGGH